MDKRIAVGMILHSISGGGIQSVVKTLARALTSKGLDVHIFIHKTFKVDDCDHDLNMHDLSGVENSQEQAKLIRTITAQLGNSVEFKAFFGHSYGGYKILNHLEHPNSFYCLHRDYAIDIMNASWLTRWLKARKYQHLFNKKKLITVSKGIAQGIIEAGIKPEEIHTIYNPIPVEAIKALAKEPVAIPAKPYIIYVGSLIKRKRVDLLLKASAPFLQQHATFQLLIIGDGDQHSKLESMSQNLGLQEQVIFLGKQSNPYPYIQAARLLVLPSDSEAFGLVLIEAITLGTPIAATACPGPLEIMTGELSSYLTPIGNQQALSEVIAKALLMPYPTVQLKPELTSEHCINQYYELCTKASSRDTL